MLIDGTDVRDFGLIPADRAASRSSPFIRDPYAEIPGANTARRLGRGPVSSKPIILRGHIKETSAAALRAALDELKWRLRPGLEHTLRWSDDATREWLVHFTEIVVRGKGLEWISNAVEIEVSVTAADPRGRNPTEQNVNSPGALPRVLTPGAMGDAPMPVIITITGNNAAPIQSLTIEYRDAADVVVHSFDWDGTDLTGSDTLVLDLSKPSVERNGVNDIDSITESPIVLPFDLDPNDGDFLAPSLPDFRITGVGTADVCRLTYRERWW